MEHGHVVRFRAWVKDNTKTGLSGDDLQRLYVPPSLLKKYWDIEKKEIAARITAKYLRIFSTLVHLGQTGKITLFTSKTQDDVQLPIEELPYEWKTVLTEFWDEQWMFCPLEFDKDDIIYKRELHTRQILPMRYDGSLRDHSWAGDGPSVKKVQIHRECNKMTMEPDTPVVFKVFKGADMEKLYRAEANVYARLSQKSAAQETITKHYGSFSFEETDTRIIVLEYAAKGSLLDFFKNTLPPVTPEEFKLLWRAMFALLTGLYALHNLDKLPIEGEPTTDFTAAIHQDIQPANILVFPCSENSKAEGDARFNVRFKLADFGFTEWRRVSKPDGHIKIKNEGNRMYSAPECYPNHPVKSQVRPPVTAKADVWALGAIYSDVLVWSIAGEPRRIQYCTSRKDAIAELKHIKERGFEACFHDGTRVLDAVKEFHATVLRDKRESDRISPGISEFILREMLKVSDSRASTDTLISRAEEVMQELESEAYVETLQSSRSPPTSHRGPMSRVGGDGMMNNDDQRRDSQPRPTTPQNKPLVTRGRTVTLKPSLGQAPVEKMYERLGRKRNKTLSFGRARDMLQGKHSEISIELPEMESAWSLIKAHGGRDQILLIDNFNSMRYYSGQVAKTARVISYVTKVADTDGMDLYFASDPTKPHNYTTSTAVELAVKKMKFVDGKCNMKNCLLNITRAVFKDGKNGIKPTSIYVYTDAVWEDASEVAGVIKMSISRLVEAKEDPSTLMFQFIQFGSDRNGTICLRKLDNDDIVDTKRWYAEVPSIVIGSISRENDDGESVMTEQSQPEKVT
ncbi:Protein kinase domain-containing protein [Fusarium sp. Ph1]|nr:Protein kinase domain-containing protein [Fusarium sp. Ph1]